MKICHIVDELRVGGLEKNLTAIAVNLAGCTNEIWCLTMKGALAPEVEKHGVRVRAFGFSGGLTAEAVYALVSALRRERFDIVHSHGVYPTIWGEIAAYLAGVRVRIDHVQNLCYGLPLGKRLRLKALSYGASKIIAVSEAVKRSLVEAIRIDPAKIELIYNSAPDMRAHDAQARQRMRTALGVEGSFVIGSIGRLVEIKGHAVLIAAVRECVDRGVDVRCLIAGDGPVRQRLAEKSAELGVAGRIRLLGMRDDIALLLSAMDALVQPSMVREGLPLVLAEGASAGLPLVATSVGGNAEIVIDGESGFIVPPQDPAAIAEKIMFLARRGDEAERMGRAARRVWQEKFSQERMLLNIKDLYGRYAHG